MDNDFRADFESIIAASLQKTDWDNADRKKLKDFLEKLGKAREVSDALGVSKETLRWWTRREADSDQLRPPPPHDKLRKCSDIILQKQFGNLIRTPSKERPAPSALYDVFLRLRTFNEIFQRSNLARTLWAFRYGRPFLSGIDQKIFDATAQFVIAHRDIKMYYVYREPEPDDPDAHIYEAKKSYAGIELKIKAHKPASEQKLLRDRLIGVPVRGAEADKLAMVDPWVSYAAAEYTDRGYTEYKRSVDVWTETRLEGEERQMTWLELPAAEAVQWMQRRASILTFAIKRALGEPAPRSKKG